MQFNPCDICLDKQCNGTKNCNCETCSHQKECPKFLGLRPTIRITTKCTQKCSHCCYTCSPDKTDMMSIETAIKINNFLENNNILIITLMGGEFFCNPDWKEIFNVLIPGKAYVRLVSNGDWAYHCPDIIHFLKQYNELKISISNDRWHTNKHIIKAEELCKNNDIKYNVATEEETSSDSLVPIGRHEFEYNFYASFGQFCTSEEHKYNFLIDETGIIYKCGLGAWDYAHIKNHLDGSFPERFVEFNRKFYSSGIMSCRQCIRSFRWR